MRGQVHERRVGRLRSAFVNTRTPARAAATLAVALFIHQPVDSTAEPASPATGHAEVIAQGVVTFATGPVHWQLTPNPVAETDVEIDTSAPTFIVSDGPDAVVVSGPAGPIARLAEGEALSGPATRPRPCGPCRRSVATAPDTRSSPVPAIPRSPSARCGHPRRRPRARRARRQRRVVLHTDVSAFVVVTDGSVDVAGRDARRWFDDDGQRRSHPDQHLGGAGGRRRGRDRTAAGRTGLSAPTSQAPAPTTTTAVRRRNRRRRRIRRPGRPPPRRPPARPRPRPPIPTPTVTGSPMPTRRCSVAIPTTSTPTATG